MLFLHLITLTTIILATTVWAFSSEDKPHLIRGYKVDFISQNKNIYNNRTEMKNDIFLTNTSLRIEKEFTFAINHPNSDINAFFAPLLYIPFSKNDDFLLKV
ncbi:hypothetical protein C2G38_2098557 [Gigaspora rosea]|uniref:Uncharacterized protein n=1 Tax=Gigaspora rosea TaxID=44941 RepID=A0A397V1X3_9GLOM|nr:hypothetical protein C2G38_2098557 [Gigaspora rosea]